jgi:hypothetical protein
MPALTGPVLATSLPFAVEEVGEPPAASPASILFEINTQDIVARTDRIAEEAADIMPTYATNALTVDFYEDVSRRDEVASPARQTGGVQWFNIATDDEGAGEDVAGEEPDDSDFSADDEEITRAFMQGLRMSPALEDPYELSNWALVAAPAEGVEPERSATA